MSISSVGQTSVGQTHLPPVNSSNSSASSEKAETRGPDRDSDADNASAKTPVQSRPSPGTGAVVDKHA